MTRWYSTAGTLAFLVACAHHPTDDMVQPTGDPGPGETTSGTDPGHPGDSGTGTGGGDGGMAASCPMGAASWARAIGAATPDQPSDVAVDAAGNVLFATMAARAGGASGLTKLSPSGDVLFSRPFGSVVAADAEGHAYVAGSFTAPLDVGLGVMVPSGNVDVFVAKLDAKGDAVFARALGLCGAGVQSIAVDATGRIAVSGASMGTAVLAHDGSLQFLVPLSGDVAFNSHGDLIIAGTFSQPIDLGDGPVDPGTANTEGFVIALDDSGQRLWSDVIPGVGVLTSSVAIDSHDHIAVVGLYQGSIDLFGEHFTAIFAGESGRVTGAYAFELDASGEPVWKMGRVSGSEANGVATDPSGNAVIAGATTGNAGFFRITQVGRVNPTGAMIGGGLAMAPASGYGRGMSVATDSCGSFYVTVNALDTPSPASPLRVYVVKGSP